MSNQMLLTSKFTGLDCLSTLQSLHTAMFNPWPPHQNYKWPNMEIPKEITGAAGAVGGYRPGSGVARVPPS